MKKSPVSSQWTVDIDELIAACDENTGLLFFPNPNNPTGTYTPNTNIEYMLQRIPDSTLLILDEAYVDYVQPKDPLSSLNLLEKYPNLVITRTFSKAYGMAGLRLGYAIAHPQITTILHRAGGPFNVNQLALLAGEVALEDQGFIQESIDMVKSGLEQLKTGLAKLNLSYLPSAANFITIDCQTDAAPIFLALQKQGIIVRPLHPYGLSSFLRVTIGTSEQNQRFLEAFKREIP